MIAWLVVLAVFAGHPDTGTSMPFSSINSFISSKAGNRHKRFVCFPVFEQPLDNQCWPLGYAGLVSLRLCPSPVHAEKAPGQSCRRY